MLNMRSGLVMFVVALLVACAADPRRLLVAVK